MRLLRASAPCAALAAALYGCTHPVSVPARLWQFDPPPAQSTATSNKIRLVVVPFDDERPTKNEEEMQLNLGESNPHGWEWSAYGLDHFPRLYAHWLAQSLSASSLFMSSEFKSWGELEQGYKNADFIVSGVLKGSTMWQKGKKEKLGASAPLVIQLRDRSRPRRVIWSREYALRRDFPIHLENVGAPYFYIPSPETIRTLYAQITLDVAQAAQETAR